MNLDGWAEAVFDMVFPSHLHQMLSDGLGSNRKRLSLLLVSLCLSKLAHDLSERYQ